jgi:tetratricopeptide (TPR) repeat protein
MPGQMEDALHSLLRLNKTGSEAKIAYQMLVKLYRSQDRFEEALKDQSDLERIVPGNKDILFEKVLLMLALHPEEGLAEWGSTSGKPAWLVQVGNQIAAANLEENETVRLMNIGRAFGGVNHWDLAEYWFQQAVDFSPQYAEAWAFLAEARQQRGLDGKEQINRALELAPDSTGVRALAAFYFRRHLETARAISLLQENIADQPLESTWYSELGSVLGETGKMEEAAAAYLKAAELAPLDYANQAALARFCDQYEYRVSDLGLPAAERAVDLAANVPEAQDIYGLTLLTIGETEKANQAFSVALSLDPEYAPTWLHIGQAAISSGDSTLAKEALLKAVNISGYSMESQIAGRLLEQYYSIKVDSIEK